jgi:hypothetical protein
MAQTGRSTSIYLKADTEATLAQVAKDYGHDSISGAINFVVRDWVRRIRSSEALAFALSEDYTKGTAPGQAPAQQAAEAEAKEQE